MSVVTEQTLMDMIDNISGGSLASGEVEDAFDRRFGDLGFDSLDRQELMGRLENRAGVRFGADDVMSDSSTPRELLVMVNAQVEASA